MPRATTARVPISRGTAAPTRPQMPVITDAQQARARQINEDYLARVQRAQEAAPTTQQQRPRTAGAEQRPAAPSNPPPPILRRARTENVIERRRPTTAPTQAPPTRAPPRSTATRQGAPRGGRSVAIAEPSVAPPRSAAVPVVSSRTEVDLKTYLKKFLELLTAQIELDKPFIERIITDYDSEDAIQIARVCLVALEKTTEIRDKLARLISAFERDAMYEIVHDFMDNIATDMQNLRDEMIFQMSEMSCKLHLDAISDEMTKCRAKGQEIVSNTADENMKFVMENLLGRIKFISSAMDSVSTEMGYAFLEEKRKRFPTSRAAGVDPNLESEQVMEGIFRANQSLRRIDMPAPTRAPPETVVRAVVTNSGGEVVDELNVSIQGAAPPPGTILSVQAVRESGVVEDMNLVIADTPEEFLNISNISQPDMIDDISIGMPSTSGVLNTSRSRRDEPVAGPSSNFNISNISAPGLYSDAIDTEDDNPLLNVTPPRSRHESDLLGFDENLDDIDMPDDIDDVADFDTTPLIPLSPSSRPRRARRGDSIRYFNLNNVFPPAGGHHQNQTLIDLPEYPGPPSYQGPLDVDDLLNLSDVNRRQVDEMLNLTGNLIDLDAAVNSLAEDNDGLIQLAQLLETVPGARLPQAVNALINSNMNDSRKSNDSWLDFLPTDTRSRFAR